MSVHSLKTGTINKIKEISLFFTQHGLNAPLSLTQLSIAITVVLAALDQDREYRRWLILFYWNQDAGQCKEIGWNVMVCQSASGV